LIIQAPNLRKLYFSRCPLGFIETALIENAGSSNTEALVYGKTWNVGLTAYRSIDPVVLALTAGYSYTAPRTVKSQGNVDPGDFLYLEPNLSFAVNDQVSLSGGFRIGHLDKAKGPPAPPPTFAPHAPTCYWA